VQPVEENEVYSARDFEAQLKALTGSALDAVITMDADGRITDWNPQAEITFGWSREEVLGRLLSETIIPRRYREAHHRGLRNFLEAGHGPLVNKRLEIEALHRDGHEFPAEMAITAVQWEAVWTFAAFVGETTPRKRVEEALAEEAELLSLLMDNVHDGIYFKDAAGRFTRINRAHAQALGIADTRQALGKTDFDFLSAECAQAAFADDQQTMQTGRPLVDKTERVTRSDGTTTWYSTTKVPLHNSQQRLVGTLGVSRDITELKRAQEELEAVKRMAETASQAKSEFLANMSHEVRTPMNGILGMTELALGTELTPEQRELLQMVKTSADSLLTIINDVLDFSKIEAGKLDLDPIEFNLRDSMDETLQVLAIRVHEKGLELISDVTSEAPEAVVGDATRIRQIIINLVGNAVKFTDRGEVVVRVTAESFGEDCAVLHFSVSDTGIGITADKQTVIFEAFSQADATTTRRYGGTGLGLTICSRLVQMMQGRIWVDSEVGKGSTFHFTARVGLAQRPAEPVPLEPACLEGVPVLVVDDNATNRRILEGTLERWGMKPTLTEGVQAALAALARARDAGHPFSLVLTDAHMPDYDGFHLAEMLMRQPERRCAIVMLTSGGQRGDAARCRQLGIAAYLTKPVRQSQLRDTIIRVLAARSLAPEPQKLVTRHSLREERRAEVAPPRAALRILVADDNPLNQRLAQRLLDKRGHTVVVAGNGREALAALEEQTFDLVLMDVQMPDMDGLEAATAIRQKEKSTGQHLRIIALTALAMKGDQERCLAAGMDGYLNKPIRAQELFDTLDGAGSPSAFLGDSTKE